MNAGHRPKSDLRPVGLRRRPLGPLLGLFRFVVLPYLALATLSYAAQQGPFTYEADGAQITITDYGGAPGVATIPATIDGLPVTVVGPYAFEDNTELTQVELPKGLTAIGRSAFANCSSLEALHLPESVVSLGDGALEGCAALTYISLPASVESIGAWVFIGCAGLEAINVAADNAVYASLDGVLFSKDQSGLLVCPPGKEGAYSIPTMVTAVAPDAFANCVGLTNITIPEGVTELLACFGGCSGLQDIRIPSTVTNIVSSTFYLCTGLQSIEVDAANPAFSSLDGVLFDKALKRLEAYLPGRQGSYRIPDGVTHIRWFAFDGCAGLTRVILPASLDTDGVGGSSPPGDDFPNCPTLAGVYFEGDAPRPYGRYPDSPDVIVYYRPGTVGWEDTFDGHPTALWIPVVPDLPPGLGDNPLALVTHSPAPAAVRVQRSVNSLDWEDWQTVSRDEGPGELQDTETASTPYRFYRGIEE